jgi:hypothetical protein
MSSNDKLLNEISKMLQLAIEEIKEDNKNTFEIFRSNFERKLDTIINIESITEDILKQETSKSVKSNKQVKTVKSTSTSKTSVTPLMYLQSVFKTDAKKFIDILYTKEELEQSINHDDLIKCQDKCKPGTALYKRKLASLVYNLYIKNDQSKIDLLTKYRDEESNEQEKSVDQSIRSISSDE